MFTYLPEIIVDMTISRVPTSAIFGGGAGMAHKGFFTTLFKSDSYDPNAKLNTGSVGGDGYGSIVQGLKHAAARIQAQRPAGDRQRKIPLWITGHSLGGSLGLLAYARFLKSRKDLGDDIELRDFYGFGTLRIGDAEFASNLESLIQTPRDRLTAAWRVDCRVDIAPHWPFGKDDRTPSSVSSIFNYAHPAPSIWVRPHRSAEATYTLRNVESFHASTEIKVLTDSRGEHAVGAHERTRPSREDSARNVALAQDPTNNLRKALWWFGQFVPCVYDHMTWSYFHALNAIGRSDAPDPDGDPARRAAVRASAPAPLAIADDERDRGEGTSATVYPSPPPSGLSPTSAQGSGAGGETVETGEEEEGDGGA
ncbi:hypothetical protein JCM6882_001620 [Rhodosporidiobolus microsporus]